MNPEKQPQPIITCVMVNDPTKSTKLANYHVNRIQVNCYSTETNDPSNSSNRTSSPASSTTSDSSSSSRLFFVDKKSNQSISRNLSQTSGHLISKESKANSIKSVNSVNCSVKSTPSHSTKFQNVHSLKSDQKGIKQSGVQMKCDQARIDRIGTKVNSLTPKSIYSEQSLKKQIHQFKERQLQNQLRYYSSTSSTASSTSSSQQFINNKYLIEKHLSDRQLKHQNDMKSEKNLSESEPLSSFNYSLNSNCSTTDTLLTNATIRSSGNDAYIQFTGQPDVQCNVHFKQNDDESNVNNVNKVCLSAYIDGADPSATSEQCCKINSSETVDQNGNEPGKGNEQCLNKYLFSIKRPTELKHYTHEIKFFRTSRYLHQLTSLLVFTAILVISLLFTIGVYISVQLFDGRPLTERTFEGQVISLGISPIWNPNIHLNNPIDARHSNDPHTLTGHQLHQLLVSDLRTKFEQIFNQSDQLSSRFKRIEITNLQILNVNRTQNLRTQSVLNESVNSVNISTFLNSSRSEHLLNDLFEHKFRIEFRIHFNSNDLDLELSASSVYLTITSELIKLEESLLYIYNLDQQTLSVKEIYPEDELDKTIQNLLRLVLNNSTSLLNNRRHLKRLQLIKLNRLNRTNQLDNEFDSYLQIDNQTESKSRCEANKLSFCSFLPYSSIMYPNLVNHHSLEELENEFIYFRQIIDSECFYLAKELLCLLVQPACPTAPSSAGLLPCGQLCEQFMSSCSNIVGFLPVHIRDKTRNSCQQLNKLQQSGQTHEQDGGSLFLNLVKNKTTIRLVEDGQAKRDKITASVNNFVANVHETIESRRNLIAQDKQIDSLNSDFLNKTSEVVSLTGSRRRRSVHNLSSMNNQDLSDRLLDLKNDSRVRSRVDWNDAPDDLTTEYINLANDKLTNNSTAHPSSMTSAMNSSSYNNTKLDNCFNVKDLEQFSKLSALEF